MLTITLERQNQFNLFPISQSGSRYSDSTGEKEILFTDSNFFHLTGTKKYLQRRKKTSTPKKNKNYKKRTTSKKSKTFPLFESLIINE